MSDFQSKSFIFTKRRTKMSCVNMPPSTTAPRCHRPSSVGRSTRRAAVRANLFPRSRDTKQQQQQQQQQHKAPSSLSLRLTMNDRNKKLNSLRTFRVQSEGDDGEQQHLVHRRSCSSFFFCPSRLFLFSSDNQEEGPMMSEILFALYFIQSEEKSHHARKRLRLSLFQLSLSLSLLFSENRPGSPSSGIYSQYH